MSPADETPPDWLLLDQAMVQFGLRDAHLPNLVRERIPVGRGIGGELFVDANRLRMAIETIGHQDALRVLGSHARKTAVDIQQNFTLGAACAYLGVGPKTLVQAVHLGHLIGTKVGPYQQSSWNFAKTSLDSWRRTRSNRSDVDAVEELKVYMKI